MFIDVPGGYLYTETHGSGQDVVLLNAGTMDLRMWSQTVGWLSAIARVTTYDYRDIGLSSPGTAPFDELDDIRAVFDAAGIESAVLVGCSEGARRALGFAHRHPSRVRHVVAASGAFGPFPDPSPEEAAAWQEMLTSFEKIDATLAASGVRASSEVAQPLWAPALDEDGRRLVIGLEVANTHRIVLDNRYLGIELDPPVKLRFPEIATPISVLVGARDFTGIQLWGRRLAAQAPNATFTAFAEGDHLLMLSAADSFEQFLRTLLAA
jgi:pimeloyl-ACP methyl ester carboxylesterase